MNRKAIAGLAALPVLAALYLGLTWLTGRMAEGRMAAWSEVLEARIPLLKRVERKYQAGLFQSTEEVTYEFDNATLRNMRGPMAGQSAAPGKEAPRFTLRHVIQHGPLPGFNSLGLARVDTEIVLSDKVRQELIEHIGTSKPVSVVTLLGITGGGSVTMDSPAIEYTNKEDGGHLVWQGLKGRFDFDRGMDTVKLTAHLPGLRASGTLAQPRPVNVGEISVQSDMKRALGEIYVGTTVFSIAEASIAAKQQGEAPVTMKNLQYGAEMKMAQEYLDVMLKFGADALQVENLDLRNVHYDVSLRHLHGPTWSDMIKEVGEIVRTATAGDPMAGLQAVGLFGKYAPILLEHKPELAFDHLGVVFPEGEVGMSGKVSLRDFARTDFALGSAQLIPKIEATADIWLAEALLSKDWSAVGKTADESSAGSAAAQAAILKARIAMFEDQGFIKREGHQLKCHLEFRNGALTVNGKTMGPAGLPGSGEGL